MRRGPVFADAGRVSHADPLIRTVEEDVRAAILAWAQAALADKSQAVVLGGVKAAKGIYPNVIATPAIADPLANGTIAAAI